MPWLYSTDYDWVKKTLRTNEMYLVWNKQTKRLLIYAPCQKLLCLGLGSQSLETCLKQVLLQTKMKWPAFTIFCPMPNNKSHHCQVVPDILEICQLPIQQMIKRWFSDFVNFFSSPNKLWTNEYNLFFYWAYLIRDHPRLESVVISKIRHSNFRLLGLEYTW